VKRGPLAALVVSLLLSGCATKQQALGVMAIGAGVTFAGLARAGQEPSNCCDALVQGFALGAIGGTILLGGTVGLIHWAATSESPDEAAAARAEAAAVAEARAKQFARDRRRGDARELTTRALAAARVGDCPTVAMIAPKVEALDRDLYQLDFAFDAAIRSCLSPTRDRHRDDAQLLLWDARTAARNGDCETVRKLEPLVRALDAEVYTSAFVADAGIKGCLAP
jgi:hypothetical protein